MGCPAGSAGGGGRAKRWLRLVSVGDAALRPCIAPERDTAVDGHDGQKCRTRPGRTRAENSRKGSAVAAVTVIGAGVVGLSVAHEFADAGHDVTVVHAPPDPLDASPLAGAVWFPYGVGLDPDTLAWSQRTRARLEELADVPGTGVVCRRGTYVERVPDADRSWCIDLPGYTEVAAGNLPSGARSAFQAVLPVVDMPRYLAWLRERCVGRGVGFRVERLDAESVAALRGPVVVAAGLRSAALVSDDSPPFPTRGQVVRVRNAGLTDWYIDEHHPDGMVYVIPRLDDVVCGGTADEGDWNTDVDPAAEHAILDRAAKVVPAVAGLPIVSRGAGARPSRDGIRLGRVGDDVYACYGHGGAGVSLSWGSAEAIVRLVLRG
ncbi:FAD-dependent oxidoreductase [Rhodococcus sp. HNM0569]|uniref:FAD-dependent oxidoreductase n=1 Tax=Rhodococcus sp. HNM0569 TaxID=2716340 RepID=UPI00146CEB10|nr:FAD-dependent oxidoreductase [Rhodococcus sp. HNM0569]NLU82157.1 FAD-dependent oxidoreductase [Rhodococcus sp. HNM0569]